MLDIFKIGDQKTFHKVVTVDDVAHFESDAVHPVYSTFSLGRDAEWVCRLFVIDLKEESEEGIGTFLNIEHQSPALVGQEVIFTATLEELKGNSVICSYEAKVGDRLIAIGKTGQKVLPKEKINRLFDSVK